MEILAAWFAGHGAHVLGLGMAVRGGLEMGRLFVLIVGAEGGRDIMRFLRCFLFFFG
jgi:hypothetical protein